MRRHWFENRRGKNKYENDWTVVLAGIGKKTAEKLKKHWFCYTQTTS